MTAVLESTAVAGLAAASPALGPDTPPLTQHPSFVIDFVETAGAKTYSKTVPIPAGWGVRDVWMDKSVAWDADTAPITMGDGDDPERWLAAGNIDLSAANGSADPEVFDIGAGPTITGYNQGDQHPKEANDDPLWPFYPEGGTFTATVVTTGAGGTSGRTSLVVELLPLPTTHYLADES